MLFRSIKETLNNAIFNSVDLPPKRLFQAHGYDDYNDNNLLITERKDDYNRININIQNNINHRIDSNYNYDNEERNDNSDKNNNISSDNADSSSDDSSSIDESENSFNGLAYENIHINNVENNVIQINNYNHFDLYNDIEQHIDNNDNINKKEDDGIRSHNIILRTKLETNVGNEMRKTSNMRYHDNRKYSQRVKQTLDNQNPKHQMKWKPDYKKPFNSNPIFNNNYYLQSPVLIERGLTSQIETNNANNKNKAKFKSRVTSNKEGESRAPGRGKLDFRDKNQKVKPTDDDNEKDFEGDGNRNGINETSRSDSYTIRDHPNMKESGDAEIVQRIFKESMKLNKDNFSKHKIEENEQHLVPEITRLRIAKPTSFVEEGGEKFEEKDIYKCADCPKVFRQRSQWKRHVDCIHLKIAKFVCIECTKAFKRSDHLKNHIRRIHGV